MDVSTSFDEQSGSIDFAFHESKAKRRIGDGSRSDVKGVRGSKEEEIKVSSYCIITSRSKCRHSDTYIAGVLRSAPFAISI